MEGKAIRVIISGGGTGGHIFPAVSIAGALRKECPGTEILFVGAEGKMEMEKVPAAGYKIVGLPIAGLQRRLTPANIVRNLAVPFKVLACMRRARRILKEFKPDIAVGVGGFASGPLLKAAQKMGIPTLLQEQNSYAGLTNKLLGRKAGRICVAYEGMERFFPADKIVMTGNPIRSDIHPYGESEIREGLEHYALNPGKDHILIVGGSLGSGTLNKAMKSWIDEGCPGNEDGSVEILWQCGKYYKADVDSFLAEAAAKGRDLSHIHHFDFIARMDLALAVADVVISRSGASTVSELCAAHKAAIFVPSPNVAEDHQTHNAMALVGKDAALMIKDSEAPGRLLPEALALLKDGEKIISLEKNIATLALPSASESIVKEIYDLLNHKNV